MSKIQLISIFLVMFATANLSLADYNPADSLDYIYASALSHCEPAIVMSWTCGVNCDHFAGYQPFFSDILTVVANDTLSFSMFYSTSAKKFITTFRGTVGDYQLGLEGQGSDGIPYTLYDIENAMVMDYFYNHYLSTIRPVMSEQLTKAKASFPDYEFIFTGHSLGAALTTLAAFDAVKSGLFTVNQTVLYNYGSPRVGNYELAQAIQETLGDVYRVVHWKDMIPHIPSCQHNADGDCVKNSLEAVDANVTSWASWHAGHEVFYTEDSSSYVICDNEDPKCSNKFPQSELGWPDHFVYLNVKVEC